MYIGKQPTIGNFQVCDAISVVNGQAAYTMQVSSVNVVPETANHMIVSLNGVIQAPGSSYTVAGSTITFASNLVTGDVIDFIHILGSVLDLGVPSDSTVSLAKLTATGTKDATTFLRGDNTFAEPSGSGLIHLQTTNITTGTASVEFTSNIDSTYNAYFFILSDVHPASNSQPFEMTFSTDGGSNYLSSNYAFSHQGRKQDGTELQHSATNDSVIDLSSQNVGNADDESISVQLYLHKPSGTDGHKLINATSTVVDNSNTVSSTVFGGMNYSTTSAITAVKFAFGSGNIDRGNFTLFGVANS